jgi:transcription antitermination factor NusG
MTAHWYALRSKPRKEEVVWRQLRAKGMEVYYPQIRVNPVNPRSKKIKPYFPGYLFIKVDIESVGRSTFQWLPHAIGLVTFGDEVPRVPENLLHAIQKKLEAIAAAGGEVMDGLKPGDRVMVESGPFKGYEAIFDTRVSGAERVRVLIKMLGDRQVPVNLRTGQIKKR